MNELTEYIITPEDLLLRRIPLKSSHILQGRFSSLCFKTKPGENGLSVYIEKLVKDISGQVNPQTHTLAILKAQIPMDLGHSCKHDPVEGNFAHALILGDTEPVAKKLAGLCKAYDDEVFRKFS